MLRILAAAVLLASSCALAQETSMHHAGHAGMADMAGHAPAAAAAPRAPTEPGQSAFAAIQQIVEILEADPATDWSRVDVEALRQHLIDMNDVTLRAKVATEPVESGLRFTVSGEGPVADSIRRMTLAHAGAMNGVGGWRFEAAPTDTGATLTVVTPAADLPKLKALGFIGVLTRGMHHQQHHLMIARGEHPHG